MGRSRLRRRVNLTHPQSCVKDDDLGARWNYVVTRVGHHHFRIGLFNVDFLGSRREREGGREGEERREEGRMEGEEGGREEGGRK